MSKKNFSELVSQDESVKEALKKANFEAFKKFIEEKGLAEDLSKILGEVSANVAKNYGFEELSENELEAVAGGDAAEDLLKILIELEKKKKH